MPSVCSCFCFFSTTRERKTTRDLLGGEWGSLWRIDLGLKPLDVALGSLELLADAETGWRLMSLCVTKTVFHCARTRLRLCHVRLCGAPDTDPDADLSSRRQTFTHTGKG